MSSDKMRKALIYCMEVLETSNLDRQPGCWVDKAIKSAQDALADQTERENQGKEYRTYQIWSEGYRATGESGDAHLMGEAQGRSFQEACCELLKGDEVFNPFRLTHWGCRLFDNEKDARRAYG